MATVLMRSGHLEGNAPLRLAAGVNDLTKVLAGIKPILTEEENAVFRRGRNAKSLSPAKNQSLHDYRIATGFEALMGYLYLSGQSGRIQELLETGIPYLEAEDKQ